MSPRQHAPVARRRAECAGPAAGAWAAYLGVTWSRYGHPPRPRPEDLDRTLDTFMPGYDVVERHHVDIDAPPAIVLAAAREMERLRSPVVRAIVRLRELVPGATED